MAELDIHTSIRGAVEPKDRRYAEERIAHLVHLAHRPILFARLELQVAPDPALERPAVAKATLDVSGRRVRAHVAAPTVRQAADEVEARLRRGLEVLAERQEARRHRTGRPESGEWHHGDLPRPRPAHFPRPVEERELVRRATYLVESITPEEAVTAMELLDHDFLLFENRGDGDCAVYRRSAGGYGLLACRELGDAGRPYVDWIVPDPAPAPVLTTAAALDVLNATDDPFVFFTDAECGRGAIAYRRYDGHYGLISPTEGHDADGPSGDDTGDGIAGSSAFEVAPGASSG